MFTLPKYALKQLQECTRAHKRDFHFSPFTAQASNKSGKPPLKDALRLPSTSFPLRSDPAKSELPFRAKACDELYRWQVRYTQLLRLHLHAYRNISGLIQRGLCLCCMMDLLTRMAGYIWVSCPFSLLKLVTEVQ